MSRLLQLKEHLSSKMRRMRPSLFFSGLDTLPQGGGVACLPFLKFWVPSAESPAPLPPVGVGQEWVGIFWGKLFVTKIFILPLSSLLPDLVSTQWYNATPATKKPWVRIQGATVTRATDAKGPVNLKFYGEKSSGEPFMI